MQKRVGAVTLVQGCMHPRSRLSCHFSHLWHSFDLVLMSLVWFTKSQAAVRVLEFLSSRDVKVNTFHFNAIIGSAGGDTGWTYALNLMEQMKRKDVPMSAGTYGAAIKSCSKANEWKVALSILSSMEAITSNEIAYSAAIKSFEKDGLWERALDLLFHMSAVTLQADIICISAAMATSAAAGQWQVALQLFHDILHNSQVFENCRPDVISLNTLISAMGVALGGGHCYPERSKELAHHTQHDFFQ